MAKRSKKVEVVARPRGRGRKKRTGVLTYYKFSKGGRVAGRIIYPQQPDGRRPTEYLPGAYESDEMMAAYKRSMLHWLEHETPPPWVAEKTRRAKPPSVRKVLKIGKTVAQVCEQFLEHEKTMQNKSAGEIRNCRYAFAPLVELYGDEPAVELGAGELIRWQRHCREERGNCANTINSNAGRIVRAFNHAAKVGDLPRKQVAELQLVEPLSPYTPDGEPEREPVRAVYRDDVEATLEYLPEAAADLVRVMLGCGARAGELVRMPADELQEIEPEVWAWFPSAHKTSKRSKNAKKRPRSIVFGPPEIAIIAKRLGPYQIRQERTIGAPVVRIVPDQLPPHNLVFRKPNYTGNNAHRSGRPWDRNSFRQAIHRACKKAGVDRWSPHQMRHAACSELYNSGIAIADVMQMLGHTTMATTENYITPDLSGLVKLAKVRK